VPRKLAASIYQGRSTADDALFLERGLTDLKSDVAEGFSEIRTLLMDLAHRRSLSEQWRDRGDLVKLYRTILGTGLTPENARDFVEKAAESLSAWGGELEDQLRKTVRPHLRTLSRTALPRHLVLMGPSGGGKTTILMKMAARLRQKGKKLAVISLDTVKLGAVEQITQFSRIMGLGLKVCQSPAELLEARDLFANLDHVLVDTSTRDFLGPSRRKDLVGALSGMGAMNYLVLPATLKAEDMESGYLEARGPFLLGVVLTKLDETLHLGNVLNFARSMGPIFAYLSLGPKPEDFSPFDPSRFLDRWLGTTRVAPPTPPSLTE
jgi:flagellar biosynthesis protein FlhF